MIVLMIFIIAGMVMRGILVAGMNINYTHLQVMMVMGHNRMGQQ